MKSRRANAAAGKMLRYILAILVVFICFAHPAAAQPNTAFVKNKGKVYTQAGEPLYLIRLAGKMTMPGYVHYALIDKQARVVSYSPRLNHFAHNIECSGHHKCLIYDVWDSNTKHHAVWNMLNDLRPEQRKNIINTPADDTEKKTLDDLMTFITSGSPNIFETSLLQNSRPFGISNVYGKLTSITKGPIALYACFLFSFYVFSAIIFHQNVYYIKIADIKYARQGGAMAPGLNAVHPMTLVFTIFFMWSVPVWHFVLMVLVYIMLLYYAFKRSSRIAALKMAAQQEISKNPTPLNG